MLGAADATVQKSTLRSILMATPGTFTFTVPGARPTDPPISYTINFSVEFIRNAAGEVIPIFTALFANEVAGYPMAAVNT